MVPVKPLSDQGKIFPLGKLNTFKFGFPSISACGFMMVHRQRRKMSKSNKF